MRRHIIITIIALGLLGIMTMLIMPTASFAIGETTRIYTIQGDGSGSDLVGQTVTTTGIITFIAGDGVFIQDPEGDGNPRTSDGIFVAGNVPPGLNVGDLITVDGVVTESALEGEQETLTLLSQPSVIIVSSDNELPDPVEVGTLPNDTSALEYYESLEGMLVRIGDIVGVISNVQNNLVVLAELNSSQAGNEVVFIEFTFEDLAPAIGEPTQRAEPLPATATAIIDALTATQIARDEQRNATLEATATPEPSATPPADPQTNNDNGGTSGNSQSDTMTRFFETSAGGNTSKFVTFLAISIGVGLLVLWWRRRRKLANVSE